LEPIFGEVVGSKKDVIFMAVNGTAGIQLEMWALARFVHYARNPRKNDHAVDRMVSSIREFGFKVPVLARSNGDVIDGHLRLKAAEQLGIAEVPVILCDELDRRPGQSVPVAGEQIRELGRLGHGVAVA